MVKRYLCAIIIVYAVFCVSATRAADISVQADQGRLSSDRTASVTVTATLKDEAGRPLSGQDVHFAASHGRFSDTVDLGDGRYRAVLQFPAQPAPRHPDYLLLLASALMSGQAPAAGLRIPIYSNLVLQGNAAPGINLAATAGGVRLGSEVTVGEDGKFKLVAPVPPGVGSVTITASKGETVKTSSVDVKAGAMTRHLVQGIPDKVAAGGAPAFVNIFAVQASGRPETRDRIQVESRGGGYVSQARDLGGGVFQSEFTIAEVQESETPGVRGLCGSDAHH